MKILIRYIVLLVMFVGLNGCENPNQSAGNITEDKMQDLPLDSQIKKISYLMGLDNGSSILAMQIEFDEEAFRLGLEDALAAREPRLSQEDISSTVAEFEKEMKKKQEELQASQQKLIAEQAEDNAKKGAEFMEANSSKVDVITTQSGLQYRILVEGNGSKPTTDNTVEVHYEGRLIDGVIFDSSIQRGEPAQFGVTQVIPGWTEALLLMSEGSKWELVIPPELAYGPGGTGPIPSNATLIFEVELLKAKVE